MGASGRICPRVDTRASIWVRLSIDTNRIPLGQCNCQGSTPKWCQQQGEGARGPSGPRTAMTATTLNALDQPAAAAPLWLRMLMMVSSRLPTVAVEDGVGARAVVAAPTSRHVAAALAVTSVPAPLGLQLPIPQTGAQVATVLSRAFCDAEVRQIGERLAFDGTQFNPSRVPPSVTLPPEWAFERGSKPVSAEAIAVGKKIDGAVPGEWTVQLACREPVVVVAQRPNEVVADLGDLAQAADWWNPLQALALIEPLDGLDWWFRRPVIVTTPVALAHSPWVSTMPARMIVVVGFTAWMSSMRHLWSHVPQVLVLNQRSSDVAEFRAWFDGTQFPEVSLPLMRNLRKAGVTVTAFGEPISRVSLDAIEAESEDEWAF